MSIVNSFRRSSHPQLRAPNRLTVLGTYRQLLRAIQTLFFHASQYAEYDELSDVSLHGTPTPEQRKVYHTAEENKKHREFANKKAPNWMDVIRSTYRERRDVVDVKDVIRNQREAEDFLYLLIANMEHSRFLLEGGWGIRRDMTAHMAGVARKVGLRMPNDEGQTEKIDPAAAAAAHPPLIWEPTGTYQAPRDRQEKKEEEQPPSFSAPSGSNPFAPTQ